MASPAVQPVRPSGSIDPRRPGEYPIVLGDSLKDEDSKNSLLNVRYNWQPKSGFKSGHGKLTESGGKYQLALQDEASEGGEYNYTGHLNASKPGKDGEKTTSLALVFDKSRCVFVLEALSATLDMNLESGPGQSSKNARELPPLPTTERLSQESVQKPVKSSNSRSADDETPDASNPYDFRHFLAEARENMEKSTQQPGNRTPNPGGNMTPMSSISTPIPGSSRFKATTPQFRPTPVANKASQQKGRRSPDTKSVRASAAPKTAMKREPIKSSTKPLSKARISDSDEDDDQATIDVSRIVSKETTNTLKPTATRPGASRGHARNMSANMGSSPHIIINDDDGGLEIDMGSPPPEDRTRRNKVDPEMFRSHTGTPVAGLSSNSRPLSRPADENRGRTRDKDVSMKDIEGGLSASEDGDVEEFELGSPRDKRLGVPHSGDVTMAEDDDDKQSQKTPAVAINDDIDDEDLLAAELEAALEEEDDEAAGHGVGLGIGLNTVQDDESEVSEEE
ncbi:hypothetical protein PV11_07483 [Exophiala sideris]|uniref:Transcription elongation factor Eaf N-terminal domain-containing protein n=1 Tax=Exophiala sideris TaxID=1016849 RepID=A0A0D1YG96_9EURO|nr:hypothetical protein PV11_07483 [Exophiala sideris]